MDSRRLTVASLLTVALTVAFVTAPVLSGEHPWDSDRTDGKTGGGSSVTTILDTSKVVPDTIFVSNAVVCSTEGADVWVSILTTAWSVSLTL